MSVTKQIFEDENLYYTLFSQLTKFDQKYLEYLREKERRRKHWQQP